MDKFGARQLDDIRSAAIALAVILEVIEVPDSYDFESGFRRAKTKHCGAVIFLGSPGFYVRRAHIAR